MNPEQHETAKLRRELRRLEEFCAEVKALAARNPRAYVIGYGAAGWSVKAIERQIIGTRREIKRLADRAKPT